MPQTKTGNASYNALHLHLSDMFIKECATSNISAVLPMRTGAIFGNETVTFVSAVKTRNLELLNVCFLSSCRTSGSIA
ncbi:hypothetical protein EMIT0P43_50358 [Pseudomonas jessenii]